jgi:hypothetical protein
LIGFCTGSVHVSVQVLYNTCTFCVQVTVQILYSKCTGIQQLLFEGVLVCQEKLVMLRQYLKW